MVKFEIEVTKVLTSLAFVLIVESEAASSFVLLSHVVEFCVISFWIRLAAEPWKLVLQYWALNWAK